MDGGSHEPGNHRQDGDNGQHEAYDPDGRMIGVPENGGEQLVPRRTVYQTDGENDRDTVPQQPRRAGKKRFEHASAPTTEDRQSWQMPRIPDFNMSMPRETRAAGKFAGP